MLRDQQIRYNPELDRDAVGNFTYGPGRDFRLPEESGLDQDAGNGGLEKANGATATDEATKKILSDKSASPCFIAPFVWQAKLTETQTPSPINPQTRLNPALRKSTRTRTRMKILVVRLPTLLLPAYMASTPFCVTG
jgi:hypothetical protein